MNQEELVSSLLDEPVTLTLQIPEEWGCYQEFFGVEPKPAFRVFDDGGQERAYQLIAQELGKTQGGIHPLKFPSVRKIYAITVCLPLRIPALGYTTLTVRRGPSRPRAAWSPSRRSLAMSMAMVV